MAGPWVKTATRAARRLLDAPLADPTPSRAAAQGFDHPVYHGTLYELQGDILRPGDFGVHVGQPHQAQNRLQSYMDRGLPGMEPYSGFGQMPYGSQVLPLQMRGGRMFRTEDPGNWQILSDARDALAHGAFEDTGEYLGRGALDELRDIGETEGRYRTRFNREWTNRFRQEQGRNPATEDWYKMDTAWMQDPRYRELADDFGGILRDEGIDTVVYRNLVESPTMGDAPVDYRVQPLLREINRRRGLREPKWGSGITDIGQMNRYERARQLEAKVRARAPREWMDSYIVLDPANLRSRFAEFDPAKSHEAGLFKTLTGAGLLTPWLLEDDDEEDM